VRLVRWLEPSSLGLTGLALILHIALAYVFRTKEIERQMPQNRLSHEESDQFEAFFSKGMEWMAAQNNLVLGRSTMPAYLLTLPADRICYGISEVIVGHRFELSDPAEVRSLQAFVQLGVLAASYATRPAQDIELVRLAAGRLVPAGQAQGARDFAETAIQMAGDDPIRKRQAWLAMADITLRCGNKYEALVALAAGACNESERNVEQAWEEYLLATRLCRDIGLLREAMRGLDRMEHLAQEVGLADANRHRLDLLRLQIEQRLLLDDAVDPEEIQSALERLTNNARAAEAREGDSTPIALTLGQVLAQAVALGVTPSEEARKAFDGLVATMPKDSADLVRAMSTNEPSDAQLLQVYQRVQAARYAEDIGFDAQTGALLARRYLASPRKPSVDVAILATEMLADRSVAIPGWEAIARPAPNAESAVELADAARTLSQGGASLMFLGMDRDGVLTRVNVSGGVAQDPAQESKHVFDRDALRHWSQHYPYRYAFDTETPNLFDLSTRGIGVSAAPDGPIVIVADANLQTFPANLWRLGDDFFGVARPVAMVPSLSWLIAARKAGDPTSTKRKAWISDAEHHGSTLVAVSERLACTFAKFGVALDSGQRLPQGFDGAELAIITAHGGLLGDGRFFQNVRDEGKIAVDMADFAAAFHNIGLVVLFVCSGGRLDNHPDAIANLGLAKQLLNAGCSTVVASPWPLDSSITHHWLPVFLERWEAGDNAVTACFVANAAVGRNFSAELRDCLALGVFGNPFLRRSRAQTGPEEMPTSVPMASD